MLCHWPFDRLHVHNRLFTNCCPAWHSGPVTVPVTEYVDPWQIWRHPRFEAFRAKMNAGDDSYCRNCVLLRSGVIEPDGESIQSLDRGPKIIVLANALACNLHCWSCRSKIISKVPNEERTERIMNEVIDAFVDGLEWLSLEQSGEIFASPMHVRLLERMKPRDGLNIELFTNGLPLPRNWRRIDHLAESIKRMLMSVDAATAETYERTRLGGRWKDLQTAMQFAKYLRDGGILDFLQFNFVVSADNFREMPDFVSMCIDHAADNVHFTRLVKLHHLSDEQMEEKDVADPRHPLNAEFRDVMKDPRLSLPQADIRCIA